MTVLNKKVIKNESKTKEVKLTENKEQKSFIDYDDTG